MSTSTSPLFSASHVTKSFPGTIALDDVSISLAAGEVRALVGPNGAGKSTLMKIIRGVYPPDAGEFQLDGSPIQPSSPLHAQSLGISMVYQELSVMPDLDVAENILLGSTPGRRFGTIDRPAMYREAERLVGEFGVPLPLHTPCGDLGVGQRQMVEILRALSTNARVLICDEPTAALTHQEQRHLAALIERLKQSGVGIFYVSHHLDEVLAIADTVTVIRDGRNVGTEAVEKLTAPMLVEMMLGAPPVAQNKPSTSSRGTAPSRDGVPALEVRELASVPGRLANVSLEVHPGEVVGLAGTLGSGCSELVRCLFGAEQIDTGQVKVAGKPVSLTSPRSAIRAGIALVPGDRKSQGIFPGLALWANVLAARLSAFTSPIGIVRKRAAMDASDTVCRRVNVKANSGSQVIDTLSGGNQQKAMLARWLLSGSPKVMLLDDPTVGVDVGAKLEIRTLLRGLADDGVGVLLVSSEFDELAATCDRILVMRDGRVSGEIPAADADEHSILLAVSGATP